jgi:hypothetical protein
MRFIALIGCCLLAEAIQAQVQDTVRENVDYRMPRVAQNHGAPKPKKTSDVEPDADNGKMNHYWGLQANQLLQQLFNFSGNNEPSGNPYVLTYTFNTASTGSGMSFGLGYQSGTIEDVNQGQTRTTKTSDINFRMGYEKKTTFGKRWVLGRGVDFLLSHSLDKTDVDTGGLNSEFKTNGWGFGPRMSVSFAISEQVLIGTELSWYYQQWKTEGQFSSVPNSVADESEKSFRLQMPTAVFLTLKF